MKVRVNEASRSIARGMAILAMMSWQLLARGDIVYQTNFDTLALGRTEPSPATGQDGWYRQIAEGDALGEIQDVVANGGRSLHQHTATTVPPALQTYDVRDVGPLSLRNTGMITLSVDFLARSSDLSTVNSYVAELVVLGGPHPGFEIIGFGLLAGNGSLKSDTGVNVIIAAFNGATNNDPIPLTVGQNLAWDTWHSVSISLDHHSDSWLSITVDGQTEDISAFQPARSDDGSQWLRGQLLEYVRAGIVPTDVGGDRTDDDVYWDNLSVTASPAVPEIDPAGIGSVMALLSGGLALIERRKRSA